MKRKEEVGMNVDKIIKNILEMITASSDFPDPEYTDEMIKGYVIACGDIIKMIKRELK